MATSVFSNHGNAFIEILFFFSLSLEYQVCTLSWFLKDWKQRTKKKKILLCSDARLQLQVFLRVHLARFKQRSGPIFICLLPPSVHVCCPQLSCPSVCPSQGCRRCQRRLPHQSLSPVKHPIRGTLPVSRPIQLMGGFFIFLFLIRLELVRPSRRVREMFYLSQGRATPRRRRLGNSLSWRHVRLESLSERIADQ